MKVIALHKLLIIGSLILGCSATYFAYMFSIHLAEKEAGSSFNESAKVRVVAVKKHLQATQNILMALKAFYDSSDDVTQDDFASFTTLLTKQELIFQAFSSLGMEDIYIEGTGIGLVVAKELVALMKGVMGFETEYGKGSTFWIEFALVEP